MMLRSSRGEGRLQYSGKPRSHCGHSPWTTKENARSPHSACERPLIPRPSGPGGFSIGIVCPGAVETGDAPFDALAKAGKATILDDREMHAAHLAVAQHDVSRAIAAWNIVGLPGPEGGFVDPAIGRD